MSAGGVPGVQVVGDLADQVSPSWSTLPARLMKGPVDAIARRSGSGTLTAMTFIQITDATDFARIDGPHWPVTSVQRTLARFDDGSLTQADAATWLAVELSELATAATGQITRSLAQRACEALGYTLACTFASGAGTDEAEDDAYLNEVIDDLDATIEMCLAGKPTVAEMTVGVRRLVHDAATCTAEGIAEGEQFGDLFIAAAEAAAIAALTG